MQQSEIDKVMTETYSPAMRLAVVQLHARIRDGFEFPDACWYIARKHGFMVEEVRKAYDISCGATA